MPPHPDAVADCVLAAFKALPARCKPRTQVDGRREWVPLAGIVVCRGGTHRLLPFTRRKTGLCTNHPVGGSVAHNASRSSLKCVALATGMKCLSKDKLRLAKGNVLHDWHAEILAIRAFSRWVVDECAALAKGGSTGQDGSEWLKWRRTDRPQEAAAASDVQDFTADFHGRPYCVRQDQLFQVRPEVSIHMYCSEAPCGDASMELIMAEQANATPWPTPSEDGLLGRGHFDQLGVVRRKPSRADAPLSLSKSCTDKLALKQCTSLLSGVVSLLVHPRRAYLSELVLPETQCVPEAVERAFGYSGRMHGVVSEEVQDRWGEMGYAFTPFKVKTTSREFEFSRRASEGAVPSNLSALLTPSRQEVLVNGMLQGRKQDDPRGASCVSRRRIWEAVRDVWEVAGLSTLTPGLRAGDYAELKRAEALMDRELVKRDARDLALRGWTKNLGDEEWNLDD